LPFPDLSTHSHTHTHTAGALPSLLALAAAVAVGAAFGVAGLTRWQSQRRHNLNGNFNNNSGPSSSRHSGGGGKGDEAAQSSRGSGNHGREPLFTPHALAARLPFGERHAYSPVAAEAGESARV
jgi:hypothetical protein